MYPKLHINLKKLEENASKIIDLCSKKNISVAGVTKVVSGDPEVAGAFTKAGIKIIGDSRIQNIKKMINAGIKAEYMLIRIPMISELEDIVNLCSYILVSELKTVEEIDKTAARLDKKPKLIFMTDTGDLREGVWYENAVETISKTLVFNNVILYGIGTNLGCYGGIVPTAENMNMLLEIKNKIEEKNNIKLEMVSGGSTATIPLIENNMLPDGINNFRLGESLICGYDSTNGKPVEYLNQDCITLEAEIIELNEKPTIPYGVQGLDAFGRKKEFTDRGIRKRAILAIGEHEITPSGLTPFEKGIEVLHSSSDHTLIDITDYPEELKIGDTLCFYMGYGCVLKAAASHCVEKNYIK